MESRAAAARVEIETSINNVDKANLEPDQFVPVCSSTPANIGERKVVSPSEFFGPTKAEDCSVTVDSDPTNMDLFLEVNSDVVSVGIGGTLNDGLPKKGILKSSTTSRKSPLLEKSGTTSRKSTLLGKINRREHSKDAPVKSTSQDATTARKSILQDATAVKSIQYDGTARKSTLKDVVASAMRRSRGGEESDSEDDNNDRSEDGTFHLFKQKHNKKKTKFQKAVKKVVRKNAAQHTREVLIERGLYEEPGGTPHPKKCAICCEIL